MEPLTPTHTFYDPLEFEIAKELERNFSEIQNEFKQIYEKGLFRFWPQVELNKKRDWSVFQLYNVKRVDSNCIHCPKTAEIIDRLVPSTYAALFSVLNGKSHIPAHCGPNVGFLNCHLGLIIPPDCEIRVGKDKRQWEEGKTIVFDDRYEHEVWNKSDEFRAVFMVFIPPSGINPQELVNAKIDFLQGLRIQMIKEYYYNIANFGSEDEINEMNEFFEDKEISLETLGEYFRL